MTKTISVKVDLELFDRLKTLSEKTGRTKTFYVSEALNSRIQDLEFIYLAKQRSEDVRAGRSATTSWEDVKKENGL